MSALTLAAAAVTAVVALVPTVAPLGPAPAQAYNSAPTLAAMDDDGPFLPLRAQPEVGDGLGAGRGHEGVDLFAPTGTDLVAVTDAVVLETGNDGGRGNYVSIYSSRTGHTYNYLHMLEPALVAVGERVAAGQVLGHLGCTGSCYGPHLHFEARQGRSSYGAVIDPVPLMSVLRPAPAAPAGEIRSAVASPALP